jgi:hypothetical protein
MPAQSRRSPSRPTRSQRRAGAAPAARTYSVPTSSRAATAVPRRSFAVEPPPIDHRLEFSFIRKDLIRILFWAALIIGVMIVLSFVF